MFKPEKIYYEPHSEEYVLGRKLLEQYRNQNIPMEQIENHNNIDTLRNQPNAEFTHMKRYLIIGTRKTHKYTPNQKVSDFLVPYTSSGCTAMCLYCYLVCHYNKCAYLRLFVNREEMLKRLIKKAASYPDDKVFEIGSNSDMVLENTITGNLEWTITEFCKQERGKLTFPTKFHMVEPLLNLEHRGRVIARVSLNPDEIIKKTEFGTSNLKQRIHTINQLSEAGYPVGILIAPVIFLENWETLYETLMQEMADTLSPKAKQSLVFEVIFMTYSYVHDKINTEAFPGAVNVYDKNLMTGRGPGKYWYKQNQRELGEVFFRSHLERLFPDNQILYIV